MPHHHPSPLQKAPLTIFTILTITLLTLFPTLTTSTTLPIPIPIPRSLSLTPLTNHYTKHTTTNNKNIQPSPKNQQPKRNQIPACTFPNPTKPLWTITNWTATTTINSTTINSTEDNKNNNGDGGNDANTEVPNPEDYTLIFHLTNALTGYAALCTRVGIYPEGTCVLDSSASGTPDPGPGSGPGPGPEGGSAGGGSGGSGDGGNGEGEGEEDTTGTIFSYNERVGSLEVYQEWVCLFGEREGEVGTIKRVRADGNVDVLDECKAGEELPKGEICGQQDGGGVVYVSRFEIEDESS